MVSWQRHVGYLVLQRMEACSEVRVQRLASCMARLSYLLALRTFRLMSLVVLLLGLAPILLGLIGSSVYSIFELLNIR